MNIAPSVSKVRALSPNYVQRPALQRPPPPPCSTPNAQPRAMLLTQMPPMPRQGGIRVRAPSVQQQQQQQQRMPVVQNHQLRPQSVQLNHQPTATARPILVNNSAASAVKQVVQIRAAAASSVAAGSVHQQPQQVKQTVTAANHLVKQLSSKANVIVLHKNSPAARNIVASRVRSLFTHH